jgi:hypothetical protein
VEESVMVTPEVVGLVGIVWLKDKRQARKAAARSPRMAISPLAVMSMTVMLGAAR